MSSKVNYLTKMPKVKVAMVKSLANIMIEFIVEHMDRFCGPTNMSFVNSKIDRFHFVSDILLKIMSRLKSKNHLKAQFLNLLITPHLRKLDVSTLESNCMLELLQVASAECPKLMTLWIGRFETDLRQCFGWIAKFAYLQVLDVSGSAPADSLLELLGIHCEYLKELHMINSPVSDAGIHGLCVIGKCKSIQVLNIVNLVRTNVSIIGLATALTNLPALQDLRHVDMVEMLSGLSQQMSREEKANIKYALSVLTLWSSSNFNDGNLSGAVSCCPFLNKVKITAPNSLDDEDLLELVQVKNLHDLTICGTRTASILFDGSMAPLLRNSVFGEAIKSLTLSHITELNIRLIIRCCPNLNILSLNVVFGEVHFHDRDNGIEFVAPLQKLATLNIVCCVCSENLVRLLSSPSLVSVTLNNCNPLTDELMEEVLNIHSFNNLERLEIYSNSRITKRAIDLLLNETNPLKVIKIRNCPRLLQSDIADWNTKVRNGNWELTISE